MNKDLLTTDYTRERRSKTAYNGSQSLTPNTILFDKKNEEINKKSIEEKIIMIPKSKN